LIRRSLFSRLAWRERRELCGIAAEPAAAGCGRVFYQAGPVDIALEACGGSHHWGRTLQALGHRVRLIPPQYVKPFVKRAKNDRNDAEAISEAAARPGMREVPVKSAAAQAQAMLLRGPRACWFGSGTQLVNAVRGHAAEFGWSPPPALRGWPVCVLRSPGRKILPAPAAEALRLLGREIEPASIPNGADRGQADEAAQGQCR
jgi:transposase